MPVSRAQQRWAHSPSGEAALGPEKVHEWDEESKGMNLPERSTSVKRSRKIENVYRKRMHKGTRVR